jgi:hypothetical protein
LSVGFLAWKSAQLVSVAASFTGRWVAVITLISMGRVYAYSFRALGMHGHFILAAAACVWCGFILMPRRHSINKPFKAFMPGAVAHQGGGWVQLFKGSEDAVCILRPSVSPWMASFWLLPSWAADFRPFYMFEISKSAGCTLGLREQRLGPASGFILGYGLTRFSRR